MRAVNLIPAEQRRGGGAGAAGRSGGAAYVLLAFLALAVAGVTAFVLTSNSVSDRRAQLGQVKHETEVAQAQATTLKAYADFAQLKQARVKTVQSIAGTRFDWEATMRDLSRVLPANVWLTSVLGTVKPGVAVDGSSSGGDTSNLRQSQTVPAIEMVGCTTTQGGVARLLSNLRLMHGVSRVSLAASEKSDSATTASPSAGEGGSTSSSSGSDSDCRHGSAKFPKFSLVIFFTPVANASAPAAATVPGTPATASASPSTPPAPAPTPPASSGTSAPAPASAPASPGASK